MTTATLQHTAWPAAAHLLQALGERDFTRFAEALDPQVRFRGLVPRGPIADEGAADVAAYFDRWFGGEDAFELLDGTIGQVGAKLYVRWSIRLRSADGSRIAEQHLFVTGDERVESIDLLCSGFQAER